MIVLPAWYRRWTKSRGQESERELRKLVRRARKELEAEVPHYSRYSDGARLAPGAIAQLEELEQALREGGATPELLHATEEAIDPFIPRLAQGPSLPHASGPRKTNLVQLRNRLKEL